MSKRHRSNYGDLYSHAEEMQQQLRALARIHNRESEFPVESELCWRAADVIGQLIAHSERLYDRASEQGT